MVAFVVFVFMFGDCCGGICLLICCWFGYFNILNRMLFFLFYVVDLLLLAASFVVDLVRFLCFECNVYAVIFYF